MTDPFLEKCGGWTPAPDVLARKYGFETAYAWGKIRRLCQLGGGTYTASHEAIANRIGMSRRTFIDILKPLIRDGYVEDLTPDLRNKPHTYSVKKGEGKILSAMQISHTEKVIPTEADNVSTPEDIDMGMRNLHSDSVEIAQSDNPTMQNLHTDNAEIAQPTMQNLHLIRESLDTPLRDITPKGVGDKSPEVEKPKKQLMGIFLEETGLKMPHRKSDIGFWWSAINEIYGLVDNNIGLGGNTIRQVVRQMRNDKLTISSPNSIVNLCRALCANAPPARNGHKLDPEKDAIYQELMQKQKGV